MFRRNPANIPKPGKTPGQTVQNAANHQTGSREHSKTRRVTRTISAVAGVAFLGTGIWGGETLGHTPSGGGVDTTKQILGQGQANRRALHCLVASVPTKAVRNPDGSVNIMLNLESGYGTNDSDSGSISYSMVYENDPGKFALAGNLRRTNQGELVTGLLAPDAIDKQVAIYAVVANGAGSIAATKLCGTDFAGETITPHVPQTDPSSVEFTQGPAGDFHDGTVPLSVFEGN